MIGLLNIGSLVFGLIAWILPIVNLAQDGKDNRKNWTVLLAASLSACAVSLIFQIFYNYYLVKIEDWGALKDTTGGVVFVATVLLTVTLALNAITFIVNHRKRAL